MPLLVGVDAGGTSINVVVERDRAVVDVFEGESANVRRLGVDDAATIIGRAVASAAHGERIDALVVGAAGAGHPEIADGLRGALTAHFGGTPIVVTDDATIALRAAVDGDGFVVIAGTGSIACARVGDRMYRAFGAPCDILTKFAQTAIPRIAGS